MARFNDDWRRWERGAVHTQDNVRIAIWKAPDGSEWKVPLPVEEQIMHDTAAGVREATRG
jgi:hypothetical protein